MCIPAEYKICGDRSEFFFLSKKKKAESFVNIDVDKLAKKYISQLFDNSKVDKSTKKDLHQSFFKPLKTATEEGYGKPIAKIEYGTPNYEMLKNLQTNVSVFAMFKSEALIKNAANLLTDDQGNLRTKIDFYKEALKLDDTYRKRYADVEYDSAVRQSRMAAIWTKAQETKSLYPNFEYMRTRSAHARQDHEAYVGIILPIDDPWWDGHFPPNGIGCKCGARVTDSPVTELPSNLPAPDKGFDMNSGKTGQCFDLKNGAYIKSVPPKDQPALIKAATKIANNDILQSSDYQQLSGKAPGKVEVHPLTYDNTDFKEVLSMARELAKNNHDVKMLPDISNPDLRKSLLPDKGVKGNKCPDYFIDGSFVADLKTLNQSTAKAVSGVFSRCNAQCNNIILKIPEDNPITSQELYQYTKGKLTHDAYNDFNNIWIEWQGKIYENTRDNIVKNNYWPLPKNKKD